ncbi:WD40 repeat domain-containing protein [Tuwongella immobilis]|uniref:Wd-40 repeat protein: Uncharacterized protein n=1 Tax=Tuwongella immobilis TaxID=692036 RepID=A0A6C2YU58_9BACT|nr:hypothetical protein [Tuwongella immobilis]VIP05026.1 wd-40 repeat protein : Uncharacterized protein OS=Kitasatospora setae (strain ATCC 33774 / DSM 43861 / JCM 3304 / KCC A-0304 / NBRC 14216 / KM-6054) GN=KSE_62270 PE=4 SV=1 [Tuwongella immobilis]VTS07409.1 wd-40 repeat protein : Uncharacterized protein OS=Kitasatospora setae (strain ATCC 33774 / DSM 43861 / JCM 3304 / KCC A-0304 / NBRC 14216 / KM-6054) GN=KSE_62270 PE=4 SV=1 [Tuwongella immobilis]
MLDHQLSPISVLQIMPKAINSLWFVGPDRLLVSGQYWSHEDDDVVGEVRLVSTEGIQIAKTRRRASATAFTAFHPVKAEFACTGFEQCTIYSFASDRLTRSERLRLGRHGPNCLQYTPDGHWLIWGGNEINPVVRWDTSDYTSTSLSGFPQSVRSFSSVSAGKLAVGGWEGLIQLWDITRWVPIAQYQVNQSQGNRGFPAVKSLALSSNESILYAAMTQPPYLQAFVVPDFTPEVSFAQECKVNVLLLLSDGGILASGDDRGNVILWDSLTGQIVASYNPEGLTQTVINVENNVAQEEDISGVSVDALAISPDGKTIAVGDSFGKVHLLAIVSSC